MRLASLAAVLALVPVAPLAAQAPDSLPSPLPRADSLAARGDTAGALAALDSAIRRDKFDAAAWHRRGLIFWNMARARRSAQAMPLATIKQLMAADTSLRMARILAPDSVRYALSLGDFLLQSRQSFTRLAAAGVYKQAVRTAERVETAPELVAASGVQLADVHWRRYQAQGRRLQFDVNHPGDLNTLEQLNVDLPRLADYIDAHAFDPPGLEFSGEADYVTAERLVKRALQAKPDDARAQRLMYALLAERDRWEELETQAAAGRRAAPSEPIALLAHGLALHRLSRRAEAEVAFDSALALVPPEERARLSDVTRLMRSWSYRRGAPSDSAAHARIPVHLRAWADSAYWAMVDPLALTKENEYRTEFLARVAFAEILWTNPEMGYRGADTDRGDMYIRFGPPRMRRTIWQGEIWRYSHRSFFLLAAAATFGTARFTETSAIRMEMARREYPSNFANVAVARRIDSVDVQVARFRVDASRIDSSDVFVAGRIPIDSVVAGLDLQRTPVDVAFGVWTPDGRRVSMDSSRTVVNVKDTEGDALRVWRRRLPMAGPLMYRVEALQRDGLQGARAIGRLPLEPAPAFGTSDLLVADAAAPRPGVTARRWTDLALVPNAGVAAQGAPLALVWESYGLTPDSGGNTRHRVTIEVERVRANFLSRLGARIVGGVADAVGKSGNARGGRVSLSFERSAAALPVTLDWVALDLGDAGTGEYQVRVTVTDLVAGAEATTVRAVRIENRERGRR